MFYLNTKFWNTASSVGIPVRSLQVHRLLTGKIAQQSGTSAWWHSDKTSLFNLKSAALYT